MRITLMLAILVIGCSTRSPTGAPADISEPVTVTPAPRSIRAPDDLRLLMHDPMEDVPEYCEILSEASERAERELEDEGVNPGFGYCHHFWARKKEILLRDYGLKWPSPQDRNPTVAFD